ncbi:MAG TPA: APC family permease [Anaerolineales bacterium]|nr:APC family permease [Anaerolineales bacterium]
MATTEGTFSQFKKIIIGKPLETAAAPHQAIGKIPGLAVFASDALSSVAYATEEILVILALAGSAFFGLSLPIALGICILLVVVTISYRQTIFAYPGGGGAYIVARDNLGELAAQTAGAALMMDYILTVAVSISSGVAQIASGLHALGYDWLNDPWAKVGLAVGLVIFMTVINLRGVKESATAFAIPTYFFLFSILLTLAIGFFQYFTGNLKTVELLTEVHAQETLQAMTVFLFLRAFSSGCAALTGVEAISNGITAFKEPRSRNAATTMLWMSSILMVLFLGITFLANQIGATPVHGGETIISQLARTIYGAGNPLYYVLLVATMAILIMAANTAYADFPRLAALHAGDGFLPRQLTIQGSRLVFSTGIVTLAVVASALIVFFRASVSGLIPLYAIGVFLSFTVSQWGMVVRWHKIGKLKPGEAVQEQGSVLTYDPQWRWKQVVNALGGLMTFVVMLVFAITKFKDGAWFILILIPTLVIIYFQIHHHYKDVAKRLSIAGQDKPIRPRPIRTIVLINSLHAAAIRAINLASSKRGGDWVPVHISIDEKQTQKLREKWRERIPNKELVVLESPYRSVATPIREYISKIREENPEAYIDVIVGSLRMGSFWEQALHTNTTNVLLAALSDTEGVAITIINYHLDDAHDNSPEKHPLAGD